MIQHYPSALLEEAVNQLSKLPGVGRKTALRYALFILRQDTVTVDNFLSAIYSLKHEGTFCARCFNISDTPLCAICADHNRDQQTVCVVENIKDVMAIENTAQYRGLYHVLGGIIAPIYGIGPANLQIDSLVKRVEEEQISEVILALSATMEGDTTNFYIFKKLADFPALRVTTIARGVSVGDELEYADEVTLGRSILNRMLFTDSIKL